MNFADRIKNFARQALPAKRQPVRLWHAAAFWAGVTALDGLLLSRTKRSQQKFYQKQARPSWAPPPWLFGPVWAANNALQLWGNVRLLNSPERDARHKALVTLQALSWVDYAAFTPAYFGLKSPILGFGVSVMHTGLTLASIGIARRSDPKVALSLAPTAAWLGYATALSGWMALHNRDELFGTKPLLGPDGFDPSAFRPRAAAEKLHLAN